MLMENNYMPICPPCPLDQSKTPPAAGEFFIPDDYDTCERKFNYEKIHFISLFARYAVSGM